MTEDIIDRIRAALRVIVDPELGQNIVDLGFVYEINVNGGFVRIVMTVTSPGCPAANFLLEGVRRAAKSVDGVQTAIVELTFEPPWTPSRAVPATATWLGFAAIN